MFGAWTALRLADDREQSERLSRLPDGHWHAAFAAAGYSPEIAGRYIRKIKTKIAEGLALANAPASVSSQGTGEN